MGRPKRKEPTVRVQVTMPRSVHERFAYMAKATGSDVNSLLRMLASLQLISWEAVHLKTTAIEDATREQAQAWVRGALPGFYPDLPALREELQKQEEQEQEQEQEQELVT